ncbi:PH domain-containing protein [Aurantiacibacter hainanensis]|uniref:PH domain-containing protein n=1 Tax=Aurantiacibacter hainanensis TaxID=3076114 RepID=UPI0030C717D2
MSEVPTTSHPASASDASLPAPTGEVEIDEWRRVNKLTMAAQMLRTLVSAIVPAVLVLSGAAYSEMQANGISFITPWLGLLLVAFIAVNLAGAWLNWVRVRYRIGANDVRVEQGIISRQARSVPYDRIQDVSLEQKLLPRLLGLVEVKFETGAGGKDELKLSYVSEAEGERLRETVRALVEGEDTAPVSASTLDTPEREIAAEQHGRTLFAMDVRRLFTFGLFNFSLVIFAVLLGALQQLEFLLPFDVWEYVGDWFNEDRIAEAGEYLSGYTTLAQVLAIIYAVVAVVVVGMASGVVRTFIRDWEFRLDRTAKGFRRRRGLLTKTDVVMPVHRVQALVVSTGVLRRRFGWHGLCFISLAQDAGSANHDVAPFAKMEEIAPIAREAGFTLPDESEDWRRASADYYFDRAVVQAFVPVVIAVVAFLQGYVVPGTLVALAAAFIAVGEHYRWRFVRHALGPEQVMSRRGWLAPGYTIASRVKLHSVEISQHPLARWRGYCTLRFGLAGGRLAFEGLRLDDAYELRAAALDPIAAVDFAKLPR